MKDLPLSKGTYLVQKRSLVYEISVLAISNTSVKIKWESGNVSWMTKEDFDFEYRIIERLQTQR